MQPLADSKLTEYKESSLHCTVQGESVTHYCSNQKWSALRKQETLPKLLPFHNLPDAHVYAKCLFMEKGATISGCKKSPTNISAWAKSATGCKLQLTTKVCDGKKGPHSKTTHGDRDISVNRQLEQGVSGNRRKGKPHGKYVFPPDCLFLSEYNFAVMIHPEVVEG